MSAQPTEGSLGRARHFERASPACTTPPSHFVRHPPFREEWKASGDFLSIAPLLTSLLLRERNVPFAQQKDMIMKKKSNAPARGFWDWLGGLGGGGA